MVLAASYLTLIPKGNDDVMTAVSVHMASITSPAGTVLTSDVDDDSADASDPPMSRSCGEEGCATILSVYNHYDFCSLHQPMIIPRLRGKVLND